MWLSRRCVEPSLKLQLGKRIPESVTSFDWFPLKQNLPKNLIFPTSETATWSPQIALTNLQSKECLCSIIEGAIGMKIFELQRKATDRSIGLDSSKSAVTVVKRFFDRDSTPVPGIDGNLAPMDHTWFGGFLV